MADTFVFGSDIKLTELNLKYLLKQYTTYYEEIPVDGCSSNFDSNQQPTNQKISKWMCSIQILLQPGDRLSGTVVQTESCVNDKNAPDVQKLSEAVSFFAFEWDITRIRYTMLCLCVWLLNLLLLCDPMHCLSGKLGGFLCLSLTLLTIVLTNQAGSTWCNLIGCVRCTWLLIYTHTHTE